MRTQHKPETEQATNCTRRQALKLAAGATGAATVGVGSDRAGLDLHQDARAGAPLVAAVIGGALVLKAVQDTADALQGDPSETDVTLLKEEASWDFRRFHNSAVRELGITADTLPYVLDGVFEDAKLAAIEALNAEKTQAEVETAAKTVAKDELSTIQKNVLELGNNGIATVKNTIQQADNAGVTVTDVVINAKADSADPVIDSETTKEYTLLNGSTKSYLQFSYINSFDNSRTLNPVNYGAGGVGPIAESETNRGTLFAKAPDGSHYPVLPINSLSNVDVSVPSEYNIGTTLSAFLTNLENKWQNDLRVDIENYVSNAYAEVAAGEIDPGSLLCLRNWITTLPMCHRLTSMSIVASPRSTLLGS